VNHPRAPGDLVARPRPITSRYSRSNARPAVPPPTRQDRRDAARIVRQTLQFIPDGSRVLDVGCGGGELFRRLGARLGEGVGIDASLHGSVIGTRYRLLPGWFPEDLPAEEPFDVITLLGVIEQTPSARRALLVAACQRLLKPEGRLIMTARAELAGLRELERSSGLDQTPSQVLVFSRSNLAPPGAASPERPGGASRPL